MNMKMIAYEESALQVYTFKFIKDEPTVGITGQLLFFGVCLTGPLKNLG